MAHCVERANLAHGKQQSRPKCTFWWASIEERTGKAQTFNGSRQRSSKLQSPAKLRRSSMKIRATSLAGPLNASPHCCCLRLELKNRVASKKPIRLNLYAHIRSLDNTWAKRNAVIPINIYHKTVQIFKWPPLQNIKMLTVVSSNQSRYQNKTNSKKIVNHIWER